MTAWFTSGYQFSRHSYTQPHRGIPLYKLLSGASGTMRTTRTYHFYTIHPRLAGLCKAHHSCRIFYPARDKFWIFMNCLHDFHVAIIVCAGHIIHAEYSILREINSRFSRATCMIFPQQKYLCKTHYSCRIFYLALDKSRISSFHELPW